MTYSSQPLKETETLSVILLAGGESLRYQNHETNTGSKLLEQLTPDNNCLQSAFEQLLAGGLASGIPITHVCIVAHPQWQAAYKEVLADRIAAYQDKHPISTFLWTAGGASRSASVQHGLKAIQQQQANANPLQLVIIHDAARPLANPVNISRLIATLAQQGQGGAALGLPCADTLKQIQNKPLTPVLVEKTLPREHIWRIQTPQAFYYNDLWQAYQQIDVSETITDDLMMLEMAGIGPIQLIEDDPCNIKLTTVADLRVLQALASATSVSSETEMTSGAI